MWSFLWFPKFSLGNLLTSTYSEKYLRRHLRIHRESSQRVSLINFFATSCIGAHNAAVWCTHQVYFRFSLFFASFHHQISSFPHHIFFISRTICFGHTTICFSSHFPNTVLWHISKELECNLTKYSLLSFIYTDTNRWHEKCLSIPLTAVPE